MRWKRMTIGVVAACLAIAPAAQAETFKVVFTAGPEGPTSTSSPTFEFTAAYPTDCRLFTPTVPEPAWAECESPRHLDNLPDGAYQLVVSPSGTHDPTLTAARSFTVDTVAPTVEITSAPSSPTKQGSIQIDFTSPDAGATFECTHTAPGGTPESAGCTSPWTTDVTADGDHVFSVVAIDAAGNRSAPASRTILVDRVAPDPPVITLPAVNAVLGSSFVLEGTTAGGATTINLFDNGADIGTAQLFGGSWQRAFGEVKDGTHVYTATAVDAAGNTSAPSVARTVRVDTVAPTVTITSSPQSRTNATSGTIGFTASEYATFTCWVNLPHPTGDPKPQTCDSPWTVPTPDEGEYRIEVMATDAAGLQSDRVPVTVVVDRSAPAAVDPSQPDATTFTFAPAESGGSFQCRLEGPSGDSDFAPCTSPRTYPGLAAGDYRFTLRTLDAAGNHSDAPAKTFSVAATPEATPAPDVAPTSAQVAVAPPTPTPQANETVVVRASSGTILVRKPGTTEFVEISRSSGIPLGSEIDARNGRVVLTAEPADGKPVERATFYAGLFTVQQAGGYVELTLSEELAPCKKKQARAAADKPKSRKLWGDGKGKFRTKGQYSSATIRGTKWLVQDSCDGTLTRVAQGVVSVRDVPKRRTVLLRAGRSYLAKPPKR
jgi:hypothetical protein